MKSFTTAVSIIAAALVLGGCVHYRPSVTHAHVGHCLTTWHDTPDNLGLFIVAEKELEIAVHEANAALDGNLSASDKLRHIHGVAHALAPASQPEGAGLGYGAIHALEGSIEHLEFAATSEDASQNVVASVAILSELGFTVLERLRTVANQAASVNDSDTAALDQTALALRANLRAVTLGSDMDGSGEIAANTAEAGMYQLRVELDAMLAREVPRYEPLPRKYVLGLVRLPNGKWDFSFAHRPSQRPTYGY